MYGASVGDTGIFEGEHRGTVKAMALWSPYEHSVILFRNGSSFSIESAFKRARVVLTEKRLDFRIDASYKNMKHIDFTIGLEGPEFKDEEEE